MTFFFSLLLDRVDEYYISRPHLVDLTSYDFCEGPYQTFLFTVYWILFLKWFKCFPKTLWFSSSTKILISNFYSIFMEPADAE